MKLLRIKLNVSISLSKSMVFILHCDDIHKNQQKDIKYFLLEYIFKDKERSLIDVGFKQIN